MLTTRLWAYVDAGRSDISVTLSLLFVSSFDQTIKGEFNPMRDNVRTNLVGALNKLRRIHIVLLALLVVSLVSVSPMVQAQSNQLTEQQWRMMIGLPQGIPLPSDVKLPAALQTASKARTQAVGIDGRDTLMSVESVSPNTNNGMGRSNVILAGSDGLDQLTITNAPDFQHGFYGARWSHTGSKLLYYGVNTGAEGSIYVRQNGASTLITPGFYPTWLPDDSGFLFGRSLDPGGVSQIFRYDLVTSTVTQLTTGGTSKWDPIISADGQHVAYISPTAGGHNDLFTMNVDGTNEVRWTTDQYIGWPSWTADGKIVATLSELASNTTKVFVFTSGTQYTQLSDGPRDYQPAVQEDGSILISSNNAGRATVYRLNGSTRTRLSYGEGADMSPDGTQLAFSDYGYDSRVDWGCGSLYWHYGIAEVTASGIESTFVVTQTVVKPEWAATISMTTDLSSGLSLTSWAPSSVGQTDSIWNNPTAGAHTASYAVTDLDAMYVIPYVGLKDTFGGAVDSVRFTCGRLTHYIGGQVTDSVGTPVGGVQVVIRGRDFIANETTDANGNYKHRWLVDGDYTVEAQRPGLQFPDRTRVFIDMNIWPRDQQVDIQAQSSLPRAQEWLEFVKTDYVAATGAPTTTVTVIYTGTEQVQYDLQVYAVGHSDPYATLRNVFLKGGRKNIAIPLPRAAYRAGQFVVVNIGNVRNPNVNVGPLNTGAVIHLKAPRRKVEFGAASLVNGVITSSLELTWPYTGSLRFKVDAYAPATGTQISAAGETLLGSTTVVFAAEQTTAPVAVNIGNYAGQVINLRIAPESAIPGVVDLPEEPIVVHRLSNILYLPLVIK